MLLASVSGLDLWRPLVYNEVMKIRTPLATVDIIIRVSGGIVLIKRKNKPLGWALPGGFIDRGESAEDAARREAREETGLEIRLEGLINVYSYPEHTPVLLVYAATIVGGRMHAADECLEVGTFRQAEIPWDKLAFRSTRDSLRDYFTGVLHRPAPSNSTQR